MIEASSNIVLISKIINKLNLQFKKIMSKTDLRGKKPNRPNAVMFLRNSLIRIEKLKEDGRIYICQVHLKRKL